MIKYRPILATALLVSCAVPGRADVIVLGSDTPTAVIGAVLADEATLEVPEGASVRVMSRSGRIQTLTGPAAKRVGDLGDSGPEASELWESVRFKLAAPKASGEPKTAKKRAATRGLEAAAAVPSAAYTFSWVHVPAWAEGDVCVDRSAKLMFERQAGDKAEGMVLVDIAGGKKAEVVFAEGQTLAPWPESLVPRVAAYALQRSPRAGRQFQLRLIAPIPGPDDLLRVLHSQRCDLQRNALIEALKDPKFEISSLGR